MGKGRINITKKGDFHFSFKGPFFLTMRMDTKKGKEARLGCGMKDFSSLLQLRWFIFLFMIYPLPETGSTGNWTSSHIDHDIKDDRPTTFQWNKLSAQIENV